MWVWRVQSEAAKNTAWLLYDTALLNSGFQMEDSGEFSGRMYNLMKQALELKSLDLEADIDVPVEEDNDIPVRCGCCPPAGDGPGCESRVLSCRGVRLFAGGRRGRGRR